MRIIDKKDEVVLDEKVKVELTIAELAVLRTVLGYQTEASIEEAFGSMVMNGRIEPALVDDIRREVNIPQMRSTTADYLEERGVFRACVYYHSI